MDTNSSRIDRLGDHERSEILIKLRHSGFPDGLLRKIADLHPNERERVVGALYHTAVDALAASVDDQELVETRTTSN